MSEKISFPGSPSNFRALTFRHMEMESNIVFAYVIVVPASAHGDIIHENVIFERERRHYSRRYMKQPIASEI